MALLLSQKDDIALPHEVFMRFMNVDDLLVRLRGTGITVPESLEADFRRFNQLRQRHMQQDYRHTEAEMKSVKTIAQWVLDLNCELRNQPRQVLEWKD